MPSDASALPRGWNTRYQNVSPNSSGSLFGKIPALGERPQQQVQQRSEDREREQREHDRAQQRSQRRRKRRKAERVMRASTFSDGVTQIEPRAARGQHQRQQAQRVRHRVIAERVDAVGDVDRHHRRRVRD